MAEQLGWSLRCVRKCWRRFRDLGPPGLERLSRRPPKAPPHQTPGRAREAILETKRKHSGWGGPFIPGELDRRRFKSIPHRRTIERFWHHSPECPGQRHRQREGFQDARRATRGPQLGQMELIVQRTLNGAQQKDSFLQIRDLASTPSILNSTLPTGRS